MDSFHGWVVQQSLEIQWDGSASLSTDVRKAPLLSIRPSSPRFLDYLISLKSVLIKSNSSMTNELCSQRVFHLHEFWALGILIL